MSCFILQTVALSYMAGTVSRFVFEHPNSLHKTFLYILPGYRHKLQCVLLKKDQHKVEEVKILEVCCAMQFFSIRPFRNHSFFCNYHPLGVCNAKCCFKKYSSSVRLNGEVPSDSLLHYLILTRGFMCWSKSFCCWSGWILPTMSVVVPGLSWIYLPPSTVISSLSLKSMPILSFCHYHVSQWCWFRLMQCFACMLKSFSFIGSTGF